MISERYLLYLDILGFSELAKTPEQVLDLYQIIDRLNAHTHEAIVFSDTMLVYNIQAPMGPYERHYYVMCLIEFAQDLLSRLIGRENYFRAIIKKGEFIHKKFENLDAFFGQALIDAYRDEKSLMGCGLFLDSNLLKENDVYPTWQHCEQYHYVFLTQEVQRAAEVYGRHGFPFSGKLLDSAALNSTYAQLLFLKDVYKKSREHPDPNARSRFQATWTFYQLRFPILCDALCKCQFDFRAISDANWDEAASAFKENLRSDYFKYAGTPS